MTKPDFLLKEGNWYGLTMFPGYIDGPYHSPIKVEGLEWLAEQRLKLRYINIGYASGLHDFQQDFEVLRSAPDVLACGDIMQVERVHIFSKLTLGWMRACLPQFAREDLFDEAGLPIDRAIAALAG